MAKLVRREGETGWFNKDTGIKEELLPRIREDVAHVKPTTQQELWITIQISLRLHLDDPEDVKEQIKVGQSRWCSEFSLETA